MRIIGMSCQAVLFAMTMPCSKVGSAVLGERRRPGAAELGMQTPESRQRFDVRG